MSALWTSEALAAATGGELTSGCAGTEVSAVAIDTRTLPPGALFVALRGERDGHAHVGEAFDRGAAAAMVHERAGAAASRQLGRCLITVGDTQAGLADIGRAGRARFAGTVIAVTGSVGKTTTKEMLRAALAPLGKTHAAEASYNNHWGVPLTLARLPQGAAFCVSEIGTNHPGEIGPLAGLVRPHVAIVTAIGASHIGNMGSLDAIAREKAAIYGAVEAGGVAIVPDDAPCAELLAAAVPDHVEPVGFGWSSRSAARLHSVTARQAGSEVDCELLGRRVRFTLHATGRHMAENAVATLAAVAALGLDLDGAIAGIAAFRAGPGRGATRPILGGRATLLDESYNASGASMRAALEVLSLLPAIRRIAVLGDMLELGDHAHAEHLGLLEPACRAADLVFACGPHSRAMFEALPASHRGAWAADSQTLAPVVADALRRGDAVLVKGSNGSKMRVVVDRLLALDHTA